jgi:phosphomannomutase
VLDPKVFKAYDVRGLYPTELDEEGARAIGRAFVEIFEPARVAVGRDMRLSAPSMASALVDGASDAGAEVLDLGMVGTEMLYFAVGELGLDGGVAVTASHNPKDYTGMKIVRAGALPVGGESGLLDIRDRALSSETDARAKPVHPPNGIASDASAPVEDRSQAHQRRTLVRRHTVVLARAHRELGEAVPLGQLPQAAEVRP